MNGGLESGVRAAQEIRRVGDQSAGDELCLNLRRQRTWVRPTVEEPN